MTPRRVLDCALAGTVLAVAAIPLAACAAAILIAGGDGPVIYRQVRIGRNGRRFQFYKLRTMVSSPASRPQFTGAHDVRITGVGRVLRRFKLDELPQLWNVLKGDMAIIGPRPEVPRFVERYTPAQREILKATPGLAGRAALVFADEALLLDGHVDEEAAYVTWLMPLKIDVDLEYERRRTLRSDLALMCQILLSIFGSRAWAARSVNIPPPLASH